MRLARYVFACFLLAGSVFLPVSGQEYFGKNKVSLGDFDWHFIETEHFTIYFDKNSLPVAEFAAKEAERSLREIEEAIRILLKKNPPWRPEEVHLTFIFGA